MLQFKAVDKAYGDHRVLNRFSLDIGPGQVCGLLAVNGSGKTTAMRIALGLLRADSGEVILGGRRVVPGGVRGVGYMPEERGLYDRETVRAQLRYFAQLHKQPRTDTDTRIDELLDALEIRKYADMRVRQLSLGNKQRVQIALALIHRPRLMILDEPFSALDPISTARFAAMLREEAERGTAILVSSHQIDVVERLADKIAVLSRGSLTFEGTPAQMVAAARTQVLQQHATGYPKGKEITMVEAFAVLSGVVDL